MIAASVSSGQPETQPETLNQELPWTGSWQRVLADAVRDPAELAALLELDPSVIRDAIAGTRDFPLRVPRSFIAKMRRGDPRDPLLLQILPLAAELNDVAGYCIDPVGDMDSRAAQGVLHKYSGRALIVATGACAVHCRYCFRRHFPYQEESALARGWESSLTYVREDPTIEEVILSGGDPLSLSDRRLRQLSDGLQGIPHVRRLRIHTRYPLVLPERIDSGFIDWLTAVRLQKVIVIHANHAREIDATSHRACRDLIDAGATVLNQSVLLACINDDVATLAALSTALFEAGVLPYYLHVLDRVRGAAHFDVSHERALQLHAELTARLPGYLVPRLVREVPGASSKTAVTE
jgi:EF-P beta-lysylation protein EpmB